MSDQPPLGETFIRTLVNFPKYAVEYVVGLIIAVLNDFALTTLALAGVAVGLTFSAVFPGLATFFVLYSVLRIVVNVAEAIGFAGESVAVGVRHGGNYVATALTPAEPLTAGDIMDGLFDQSSRGHQGT